MIKRETIVLLIAALCGIFAFLLIFNFLREAASPKKAIVVTTRDIEKGMTLRSGDLTFSRPVKNLDTTDYYLQIHDIVGKKINEDIPKGKGIKRSNIKIEQPKPKKRVIKADKLEIPPDKTGLTLKRKDLLNINNTISVGSYMDIMGLPHRPKRPGEIENLVRGAQVVSIKRTNSGEVDSLTLAVNPEELQPTFEATSKGKLTTVVRMGPADDEPVIHELQVIRGTKIGKKIKFQDDL